MKTFITTFIISLLAITTQVSADSNVQMCKTFIKQAHTYSATMKNESDYDKTLTFYKGKIAAHCGPIISKPVYDIDYFAQVKAKNSAATVEGCKTSIAMAKKYDESTKFNRSTIIAEAHRVNIIDNCGTLVAKKSAPYCLYDKVASK